MLDPIAYRAHTLKDTISLQLEGELTKRNDLKEYEMIDCFYYIYARKENSLLMLLLLLILLSTSV